MVLENISFSLSNCQSLFSLWGCPRGVMVQANTLGKGMNLLILPAMG